MIINDELIGIEEYCNNKIKYFIECFIRNKNSIKDIKDNDQYESFIDYTNNLCRHLIDYIYELQIIIHTINFITNYDNINFIEFYNNFKYIKSIIEDEKFCPLVKGA